MKPEQYDNWYKTANAERLPYADNSFDHAIAITSLCFVSDEEKVMSELFRVAKKSVVVGLLNRNSLLWVYKGRSCATSGYSGAHWHTPEQARSLFLLQPVRDLQLSSAVLCPGGGIVRRAIESIMPSTSLFGGFLLASGAVKKD